MGQKAKTLKGVPAQPKSHLESLPTGGHNPFWQSSLFNEVYLQNDVPIKFLEMWAEEESGPFQVFCNQFQGLCEELASADLDSWSERNTINRFIKPVLEMLGYSGKGSQEPWAEDEPFTVKENSETKTYKPDLIIVNDPKELKYIERKKGQEKVDEARSSVIVPIEAKYWGRIEDVRQSNPEDTKRADKKDQGDSARALDFDEQCLKYMEILNKDFGILTDGRTWRLYHSALSADSYRRNFQFNLGYLLKHVNAGVDKSTRDYRIFVENAKYFFHIFSKKALHSDSGERVFVDDLLEYSKKYVTQVEEDLKSRFVNAMSFACNGYLRSVKSSKEDCELETIRNVAESQLFNILFIRYCESKNVLPMKDANYRKISISSTIDKLSFFNPEKEEDGLNQSGLERAFNGHFNYRDDGTELYDRLIELTKIVQVGTKSVQSGFEIRGFTESIFSKSELKFVNDHKLNNKEMSLILFELGYCETKPSRYQQIPYNFFSPRQLGSIYESFLEFRLEKADEDMAFISKQWAPANLKSEKIKKLSIPKVKKSQLFFSPNNRERKITGSYYTPDNITQYIVRETLGPLVKGKSSKEIARLKVCDPAMGSGHFLSAALSFMAREYLVALERETNDDLEVTLLNARRILLPTAIFGVDLNSRAVKLAKMSLWLETAEAGKSLEGLDDQLKQGNSLVDSKQVAGSNSFSWIGEFEFLKKSGFDCIVGNPPYVFTRDNKFSELEKEYLEQSFSWSRFKINSAQFFVELSLRILKEGGRLGFILPNTWLTIQTSDSFRKSLVENSSELIVTNCLEKIFEDAVVDNAILVSVKRDSEKKTLITTQNYEKGIFSTVSSGREIEADGSVINFSSSQSIGAQEKLDTQSVTLISLYPVKTGLQAYEVGKGKPKQTEKMKKDRVYHHAKRANSKCRKYLEGRDVKRFDLGWSGEYLEYGSNLAAQRDPAIFGQPRVLVRQIPTKPPYCMNAVAVEGEEVNDINSMVIVAGTMQDAHYITGILNSRIVSDWFVAKFDKFQRKVFPQIKVKELSLFPFPHEISDADRKKVIEISKAITSEAGKKKIDSRELKILNEKLDDLVSELFKKCGKKKKAG